MNKRLALILSILFVAICGGSIIAVRDFINWLYPLVPDLCQNENITLLSNTSKILWQKKFEHGIAYAPAVDDDIAIVVERNFETADGPLFNTSNITESDKIHAIDLANGTTKWVITDLERNDKKWSAEKHTFSKKYYAFNTRRQNTAQGDVVVIDRATGKIVWNITMSVFDLALSDTTLFVRAWDRNIYAYDISSHKQLWMMPYRVRINDGLLFSNGFLYEVWGESMEKYSDQGNLILSTKWGNNYADDIFVSNDIAIGVNYIAEKLSFFDLQQSKLIEIPPISVRANLFLNISEPERDTFPDKNFISAFNLDQPKNLPWKEIPGKGTSEKVIHPTIYGRQFFFVNRFGELELYDFLNDRFVTLLKSSAFRSQRNIPGGYYDIYKPGLSSFPNGLLVSFGCHTLVAVKP